MSYRVTHGTMYSSFIGQMNGTLASYLDAVYQGSTTKKINKASDDAAGMANILNYRNSIAENTQYQKNVDTALGWLTLADGVLQEVDTVLIRLKELAEQAATGTLTEENRLQIAAEANQLYMQLINLANTEYNDRYIFSGQSIDTMPYELGIGSDCNDSEFDGIHFETTGTIDGSIYMHFTTDGTIPMQAGDPPLEYSYTTDGGTTWTTGTLNFGDDEIDLGTAKISIPAIAPARTVTAYDPDEPVSTSNGTSFTVRPAAIYNGYDNSVPPEQNIYGSFPTGLTGTTNGIFTQNTQIRFDDDIDFSIVPQDIQYSYSTDNGQTWHVQTTTLKAPTDPTDTSDAVLSLPIPGGYYDFSYTAPVPADPNGSTLEAGTEITLTPQSGEVNYESAQNSYITVNSIGVDIFGGLYTPQGTDTEVSAFGGSSSNLFETIGAFIGALEINDQDACGQALEDIADAMQTVLLAQADIGARTNRLTYTSSMLEIYSLDMTERMSYIEDVDITALTIQLAMSQTAYQMVLQSTSNIMQLNLAKFL